ncbi:zinc-dependent metalloprotease [Vibrio gallicus]|uniref:zinc-dependent metalloprotease n=1 Tax=Vibrio gallicus TaxID=190897 RepID=UPI0021C4BFDB|nr:zinc-dependent metalloprotease [Vibrio gallicus]
MKKTVFGLSLVAVATGLVGCGPKDQPYDTVDRSPYELSVADLNQLSTKTFLYRRMMGETPRYLTALRGKVPDDVKLVKLITTENGIQVVQFDDDVVSADTKGRFDTENNYRPILTIGGKYVDYKCSEDSYDKCTNKEQVDSSAAKTWDQKRYFVPDFSNVTVSEKDINDLFGTSCAVKTESSTLTQVPEQDWKGYLLDLKNGVINFELSSIYSVPSKHCIPKFTSDWDFDKLSFQTTEYFSLVERDKVVSKDYKVVPYQHADDLTYGMFHSNRSFRDENYVDGQDGYSRSYLNRFNPNKDQITYYLSNNFWNKDNAIFLAAAKEAEAVINVQNEMYKTGLPHINFKQAKEKRYGDLRYSYLRLYDQPLDNGLLGVANYSNDPLTGEIISGGFNQFSANFLGNAAFTYNSFVRQYNLGRLNPEAIKDAVGVDYPNKDMQQTKLEGITDYAHLSQDGALLTRTAARQAPQDIEHATEQAGKYVSQEQRAKEADQKAERALQSGGYPMLQETMQQMTERKAVSFAHLQQLSEDVNGDLNYQLTPQEAIAQADKASELYDQRMAFNAEHNIMTADAANLGANYDVLPKGVKGYPINWKNPELWVNNAVGGKLKKLKQLPKALRHDMIMKTAAAGFVGTIIHEFGHSIGLRHNFKGSLDYTNFFTADDIAKQTAALAKLGYKNVSLSTASTSQMEYNQDMFGMGFGPYDLATLRFGYSRQVQANTATYANWNNPEDWYSLEKYDQQRRDEWAQGIEHGATDAGSLAMLRDDIGGNEKLISYKYCTDGNRTLNSDCNMFDMGYNKEQIAQYYIEQYLDRYKMRNTRDDRAKFYDTSYSAYISARKRGFNTLHEFIEDAGGLEDRVGWEAGVLDSMCAQDNSSWLCDGVAAKDATAKFFLQVASQPDSIVSINFRLPDGKIAWPSGGMEVHLNSLLGNYAKMDKSYLTDAEKLKPGQVLTQYSDAPKVFDELAIQSAIKAEYQDKYRQFTPVVKVIGRQLNSAQATVKDPQHPYSNEVDLLGVWPDRLLAVQQLVTRHTHRDTSGLTSQALVDYAPINKLFKDMLCRMTMANNEDDKFQPYMVKMIADTEKPCDDYATPTPTGLPWAGVSSVDDFYTSYTDMVNQNIEALTPDLTRATLGFGFDRDFGEIKGKTNLLHAMLNQVALYSTDSDTASQEKARVLREFVGIHQKADYVAAGSMQVINLNTKTPDKVTIDPVSIRGKQYIVTDENVLAKSLMQEIAMLKQYTPDVIAKLYPDAKDAKDAKAYNDIRANLVYVAGQRIKRDQKALEQLPVL